jgi:hypothetical protein
MATKKKLLQAAAGSAGGGGLDITDVFSTYLYTGGISGVTNDIDLAGEGGMVWGKQRTGTGYPWIFDTERGHSKWLYSNANAAEQSGSNGISSFNSDGFNLQGTSTFFNSGTNNYVSWTFRKAPKFLDVIQYVGNNTARTISHDLGCDVGMIMIKCTDTTDDWVVYHRKLDATNPEDYRITLNGNFFRESGFQRWNSTAPTSTEFSLGTEDQVNDTGKTFIAYVFAHNDGDGEFGPDSDQDIVKCGSYTGNGSSTGPEIDLGFEPQWLLIKKSTGSFQSWAMYDTMRGIAFGGAALGGDDAFLAADTTSDEIGSYASLSVTSTGFKLDANHDWVNTSGETYIYMAIRRGPLAPPEDATEVFKVATRTANEPAYVSDFTVDMALRVNGKQNSHSTNLGVRQTGIFYANTDSTYQFQDGGEFQWDYMNGWNSNAANDTNSISWMWKRAPSFCDIVCWNTENTANRRLKHNLGVAPEMVWIKSRPTENWYVYHSDLGSNIQLTLNTYDDVVTTSALWPSPSATEFGIRENAIWNTGTSLVGFFFATLDGISKVGSFTGNGSSQTIDCGFTAGSRFILIKRTDLNGNWVFFDSVRGIITGISPSLFLNDTQGERTYEDVIDPASSGFIVNQETAQNLNVNGANYIFYAIA